VYRSRETFDVSVVLLDTIVQIFALTDCNTLVMVSIQLFQTRLVRPTLIDIHQTRVAVFLESFLQKA